LLAAKANVILRAGVPQVILPGWTDCYDFANRVEFLGIGRCGSTKAKPSWKADELGYELQEVVLGPNAAAMKEKATQLAAIADKNGDGADIAARALLDEINNNGVNVVKRS
jgi:UDP:flavonoid glycosyltransferase YjiC (YdhE family)